jgi:hypothetical protein
MYGLHPLIPIEYIVLVVYGNEKDSTPVRVLTSRIIKLKKLQENRMKIREIEKNQQWNRTLWNQQMNKKKTI